MVRCVPSPNVTIDGQPHGAEGRLGVHSSYKSKRSVVGKACYSACPLLGAASISPGARIHRKCRRDCDVVASIARWTAIMAHIPGTPGVLRAGLDQDPDVAGLTMRLTRAPIRKADLHPRVAPRRQTACRRCSAPSCSRHVRHLRGRGCGDPRSLRSRRRTRRCGRVAPALPRHHQHREGTRMRPDHRRLEAAIPAAPSVGEDAPPTQGLMPGGRDGWPARSYAVWSASAGGGEKPLKPRDRPNRGVRGSGLYRGSGHTTAGIRLPPRGRSDQDVTL
jgi:hypothetical protein